MIEVQRYGRRNWAVYLNGSLLVVTVYKKGAVSVRNTLESALALASANQVAAVSPSAVAA